MPSPSCAYAHLPVFAPHSAGAALPDGEDRPVLSRFADVVRSNQARILRLATGMLRDRDVAEDVAQETFVRAFRFYASFRSEAALSTWLYRIAVNLCIDAQRKQARTERRQAGGPTKVRRWSTAQRPPARIRKLSAGSLTVICSTRRML